MLKFFRRSAAAACLICLGCFTVGASRLKVAESLRDAGRYEEAITEYQLLIDQRLHQPNPAGLNPYFYYLLIGDCYLKLGRVDEAKVAYATANEHGVEKPMVAGKIRGLAAWYEEQKRFDDAISVLRENRELDPLLFDLEIDRNHKSAIEAEDQGRESSSGPVQTP